MRAWPEWKCDCEWQERQKEMFNDGWMDGYFLLCNCASVPVPCSLFPAPTNTHRTAEHSEVKSVTLAFAFGINKEQKRLLNLNIQLTYS